MKYELGIDPGTGKRKTKYRTFRGSRREAKDELVRLLETVRLGEHVDASKLTVAEYLEQWQAGWVTTQVGGKTGERYIDLLRLHVQPYLGALPLQKLQPVDLTGLYGRLLKNEKRRLAARTVGHVHRVMHKALAVAVERNLLARNPAAQVSPPRVEATEIEIPSVEQVQTILRLTRGRVIHPFLVVIVATGMRRGEELAQRWCDIDWDAATIRVERAVEETKANRL